MIVWQGLFAPKGVSAEALDKLQQALQEALKDPKVNERLSDLAVETPSPELATSEGLKRQFDAEIALEPGAHPAHHASHLQHAETVQGKEDDMKNKHGIETPAEPERDEGDVARDGDGS